MGELNPGLFFLTTPQREGLRDALVQPAELAGYRFEAPAMVEDMLAAPGVHARARCRCCSSPRRSSGSSGTRRGSCSPSRATPAWGGLEVRWRGHADSVLSGLSPQGHVLARAVLLRLVTPERTRAIVSLEELGELSQDKRELQRATDQLIQARLLVVQTGGGATGATVELVHESPHPHAGPR